MFATPIFSLSAGLQDAVNASPLDVDAFDAYFDQFVASYWSDEMVRGYVKFAYYQERRTDIDVSDVPKELLYAASFARAMRERKSNIPFLKRLRAGRSSLNWGAAPNEVAPPSEDCPCQKTAIICAMEEEIAAFRDLEGSDILLIKSGVGKVNGAIAVMDAIRQGATRIISTGFAGAIYPDFHPGNAVIIVSASYHDVDATALGFEPAEIPYADRSAWDADRAICTSLFTAMLRICGVVRAGTIASGDRFVTDGKTLRCANTVGCVDMETAAIAQVCHAKGIPWAGIRLISDYADGRSANDFVRATATSLLSLIARIVDDALDHSKLQ